MDNRRVTPSMEYDAATRELLQGRGGEIYLEAVESGSIPSNDKRFRPRHADSAALRLLVELGLLIYDQESDAYVPGDPTAVQSRVVAPLGQQAADLLTESTEWASAFSALGQVYRRNAVSSGVVTELRGYANINRFIQTTLADAETEVLTAQPSGGRPQADLDQAIQRDAQALKRGVSMRMMYQHSARRSQGTRNYVTAVTALGAEVRTLDEFFNRMIVVDRSIALIPGAEGTHVAVVVNEPNVVAYLVDVFERYWERARGFTDRQPSTTRDIAMEQSNITVRMLAEGHSDVASAKRIGVSARTYAAYVAALKDQYGAHTRFQLGYLMGQQSASERRKAARQAAARTGQPEDEDYPRPGPRDDNEGDEQRSSPSYRHRDKPGAGFMGAGWGEPATLSHATVISRPSRCRTGRGDPERPLRPNSNLGSRSCQVLLNCGVLVPNISSLTSAPQEAKEVSASSNCIATTCKPEWIFGRLRKTCKNTPRDRTRQNPRGRPRGF